MKTASREQFDVQESVIVHFPTGARFLFYIGKRDYHGVDWGRCADVRRDEDVYLKKDVEKWVAKLRAEYLTQRVRTSHQPQRRYNVSF